MTVTTPLDYGLAAYATIPAIQQARPGEWVFIDPAMAAENTTNNFYPQQENDILLSFENQRLLEQLEINRRIKYVQAQQGLLELLPNYTDPALLGQQVQWLAAML